MLIEDFDEFVKTSIDDVPCEDGELMSEQEEKIEDLPEVLGGDMETTGGIPSPDGELRYWEEMCPWWKRLHDDTPSEEMCPWWMRLHDGTPSEEMCPWLMNLHDDTPSEEMCPWLMSLRDDTSLSDQSDQEFEDFCPYFQD